MVPGFQDGARSADFGDTLGFNVRGGYRLNEYWASVPPLTEGFASA